MKKILSVFLVLILMLSSFSGVSAETGPSPKEEVVYGILNHDGSVRSLYVVNIFNGGNIVDYGSYSQIRNLTTSEKISMNGDRITINTSADRFYYQGTLVSNDLPWKIEIEYFLDNKKISGKDLAGKSGNLKIHISVSGNGNSIFFSDYALQISLSLDSRLCSDIKAENATLAEAGGKKQITYTVLPGTGADITVTADVKSFEMDPISVNGIKLALDFDIDIDISDFKEQISELTDAIKALDDGAADLLDGIGRLSDGMQAYINGLNAFNIGLAQLAAGADSLSEGALQIKNGLSGLSQQNEALLNGTLAIQNATFGTVNSQLVNEATEKLSLL